MTLGQINAYTRGVNLLIQRNTVNNMGAIRSAHHADNDQYKQIVSELQREM